MSQTQSTTGAQTDIKLPVIKKSNGQMTGERAKAIVTSRKSFNFDMANQHALVNAIIKGTPTKLEVRNAKKELVASRDTGEILSKMLYNVDANDAELLDSPVAKALRKKAFQLEKAGDKQLASDYWNAWANFVQVNFSIIVQRNERLIEQLSDGTQITGNLELVKTADGGTRISIDGKSVKLRQAITAAKTTLRDEDDEETPETPNDGTPIVVENGISADELKNLPA
jgi:hypothetical protein